MKARSNQVFVEFKESSVHLLDGTDGAEFPLERESGGRISAGSAGVLTNALRGFLQRHGPAGTRQAVCALPARGVTLRTITLPAAAKEDPERLLAMQIEAQFPVPPSELAWGYAELKPSNGGHAAGTGSRGNGQAEFLVAAVRKEILDQYASLLSSSGLAPVFTVAGLARTAAANGAASFGLLEVGNERSELVVVDERSTPLLRVVNWGRAQGENLESLRNALPQIAPPVIYISSAHLPPPAVASALPGGTRAEPLPVPPGPGVTAATHGLRTLHEQGRPVLLLGPKEKAEPAYGLAPHWKWTAGAIALLVVTFVLRYAEPVLFRTQLQAKLAELSSYRSTLPKLDRELGFLNYIKTNQPPYLDTLAVISSAAPPGTRFDQVTVVRRGEFSVRGSVQNPQGPEQFRSKLIDSGFFSKVVVEEQGPAPGGQGQNKINFRVTGVLKPEGTRKVLPPEPPLTNQPSTSMPMPGGMMPMDMPPGMPPPGMMPQPGMPPGVIRSRSMPPGIIPPGAMPPGAMPIPEGMPQPIPQPMPPQ